MTLLHRPEKVITVGQLRQNPAAMIHDVEDGEEYVLTDRGRRVARIVPYSEPTWVAVGDAVAILNAPGDSSWLDDIAHQRSESDMKDPWAE